MNDNEIIRDFFMSRLERDGKSETLLDYTTGIRYYYQDFEVRSRKLANFLTDKAKIKKGDRVAICAGNCVQHIDMFYAIVRIGYIMTSYNVKLTERELSELILKEKPSVLLYEEEFKEKAHQATLKLQSGYAPYTAIWKHIMKVSVEDLKKNYGNLNVDFDLWKGESDAQPYIPGLIQDLIDKKLAYESQGALVVDISKEDDTKELPPCIVRKSDGAALYATSDLATIIQREQDYKPNHYIYVADKRQELHFTQVFRVSKKANIVDENTKMEFLGFGTMNGKDGKPFKTRDGGVMRLESLIAQINKAVYDKIMENRTVSEEEANNTAKIVGLAALKYGDLSNQASKDYIFDIDRFASFEGNTGPYILYTIVRIKSILEKYKAESGNADVNLPVINTDNGSQMQLMLEVAKFNEIIENAAEELAPHKICSYVYDLSNAFNRFYHETKILAEEDQTKKAGYIALINLTINVLEQCIDLLGFSAPDRM